MVRELIIPQAVVRIAGKVENADYLTAHRAEQIGLNEREFIHMQGRSGILLDFSRELQGSLRIVTGYGTNGARIRIRLGESVGECLSEIGEKGSTIDHALRDVTLSLPMLSDSEYLASGFRFANVELLDEGAEVRLKAVNAVYIHSPRPQVGSFACSDETINRIYDTAAYTVQLCAQRYIWDGIKRDRLVWVGDLYPEVCALLSVCNDDGCVPDSLDFVRAETPLPGWMNNYPMYSMWWIMIVEEYYRRTGNLAWVTAQRDYFYDLLRQIELRRLADARSRGRGGGRALSCQAVRQECPRARSALRHGREPLRTHSGKAVPKGRSRCGKEADRRAQASLRNTPLRGGEGAPD